MSSYSIRNANCMHSMNFNANFVHLFHSKWLKSFSLFAYLFEIVGFCIHAFSLSLSFSLLLFVQMTRMRLYIYVDKSAEQIGMQIKWWTKKYMAKYNGCIIHWYVCVSERIFFHRRWNNGNTVFIHYEFNFNANKYWITEFVAEHLFVNIVC